MSDGQRNNHQRQLWLVPGQGTPERSLVADVAVERRTPHLHTYAVPEPLQERVQVGAYVRVPYGRGNQMVPGFCVRTAEREWDHTRKAVAEVISPALLTAPLVELGLWIGEYYACSPGLTLAALVPAASRRPRVKRIPYVHLTGREPDREPTSKQRALLAALAEGPRRRDETLAQAGVGPAVLSALVKLGLVEKTQRQEPMPPSFDQPSDDETACGPCPEDDFVLTPAQTAALTEIVGAAITPDLFRVFLLFGVPGSGKTEVYVRAIRRVIAAGRQAILLVPEIALATQIVQRLARRFERVAVFHGRLSDKTRRDTLHAVAAGAVDVVIGTRSALFAPLPKLGLIAVDEEQDSSYKNLAAPFYHARDAAIKRAQIERVPVILGSATPSLETWHNAQTLEHYRLLRLDERVAGARLPDVRLVDTTRPELGQQTTVLSEELRRRLTETLAAGQQAILLHNRRGYSASLRCAACHTVVTCPRCTARMVYHQADGTVRCHRCGVRERAPARCPDTSCGGRLERVGLAIQRLEEELSRTLPEARCLRLDRDTMRHRDSYAEALGRFEAGEADILLGTQMVAKGLDFPRVRLVGVIDADAALSLPDFRAGEQVFQLITQVVGRAGRREGDSLALVQSADVAAPAIRCALRMDYESFAAQELAARRRFGYPPFTRMMRMILADSRPDRARQEADRLARELRTLAARVHADLHVDEAGPCAITRLRQMLRHEVIARAPRDASLQRLLHEASTAKLLFPRVQRFTIDVDPIDML